MTTWDIVEDALAQRRQSMTWLADQLGTTIAVVSNWKARNNVPAAQRRGVATVLGLTTDQLEGYAPLPWERPAEWPFEDRSLFNRVKQLSPTQRLEIQGLIRRMVVDFEREAQSDDHIREEPSDQESSEAEQIINTRFGVVRSADTVKKHRK